MHYNTYCMDMYVMLSVTCPGVRALTEWDSEIHTEPSRFSVTVHGAEIKK